MARLSPADAKIETERETNPRMPIWMPNQDANQNFQKFELLKLSEDGYQTKL
jgi:hypothetical protein